MIDQYEAEELDRRYAAGFDARGTTGIAIWLPRDLYEADNVQAAMKRGVRLGEVVTSAVRNWLEAHGAPDAWVHVAIQQRSGTDADNSREALAFWNTIMRAEGPLRASAGDLIAREPMVGRWGADWREGDVVDTIQMVATSACADLGPRWTASEPMVYHVTGGAE